MDSLYNSTRVPVRVSVSKLKLVPERIMPGLMKICSVRSKRRDQYVDRRQFCRCIIGVSGVLRGPYCMCKTKMAACALRIKCCVLESCCSFDGSFSSRSTNIEVTILRQTIKLNLLYTLSTIINILHDTELYV